MAHILEIPQLGAWVTIHVEPGCDQELRRHGIAPLVNGMRGQIRILDSREGVHCVGVDIGSHRQWFMPAELLTESMEEILARFDAMRGQS